MKISEKNLNNKEKFKLTITQKAQKEMNKLPSGDIRKIDLKIKSLPRNPYTVSARKLAGSKQTYRIRQGDYRIIYEIERNEIIIMSIGHRRNVYR